MLFFGSVLVHELAHALVAQARGIRVQDITLFLFGGATRARVESRGPGDEFLIALVGPLTSGLLAALFGIIAGLGGDSLSTPLAGTLGYLAWTNLLLAGFNLVPGFPLDGGRLLRSAIWKATGSLTRATRVASVSGQGVGWLLVAAGVAFLLAGDLAGGIWFAFIGWFLVQAARSSYQELQLQQLLRGVEAEDVMAGNLLRIPPELSLQDAVDDYFMRYDHSAFPVDEQGRTIGLLTLRGVRRVPREQWSTRGSGLYGPARRPGRGGPRCPDGRRARQAPGRRGRPGPGSPGWRGGGDHHPIGPDPVAAPVAGARRQSEPVERRRHGRIRQTCHPGVSRRTWTW